MVQLYQQFKLSLVDLTGLSKDSLHIYVALLIVLGCCALFRWKVADWRPVLVVLLFELGNELMDLKAGYAFAGVVDWSESIKDVGNTLLLPLVLLLGVRFTSFFQKTTNEDATPLAEDRPVGAAPN